MQIQPIATIRTPYKQKFAIPRQPGLAAAAIGEIHFLPEFNHANLLRGLEQFSHVWLSFYFHATAEQGWNPTVRPPRLGGNQKVGVFATRSTFRPNPLGLSVVEFAGIEQQQTQLILKVRGVDLLDDTPILDIKPYLPYADALPHATASLAPEAPEHMPVAFSPLAQQQLDNVHADYPELKQLISQILAQDPRPAYKHTITDDPKTYTAQLYNFDVQWQVHDSKCQIQAIKPI